MHLSLNVGLFPDKIKFKKRINIAMYMYKSTNTKKHLAHVYGEKNERKTNTLCLYIYKYHFHI
jgi:N-glycosylase/DNA lyase